MSVRCFGFFPRHLILVSRFVHFHVHPCVTRITMLFYHTKYVLCKQQMKKSDEEEEENLGLDEEVQDDEDN